MEPPAIPAGIAAAAREMTPGGVMRTGSSAEVTGGRVPAATGEMAPARGVTAASTPAVASATAAVLGKRRPGADQDRPQNAGC
jgi:hypothetical protein